MLKIKYLRELKKLTQDEMVAKTGIPKRSYVDYENQKQDISLDRLRKIANALNVSVSELLGEGNQDNVAEPNAIYTKTKDGIIHPNKVPLFNLDLTKGLFPLNENNDVDTDKIIDYILIPGMPFCDGAIYASGDGMYPLLKAGDIVTYKCIEVDFSKIFFGEMYVLAIKIDEDNTMKTIKMVHKSDLGDSYIKLISHNQHHAPKDIHINEIEAIALIRASIRLHS